MLPIDRTVREVFGVDWRAVPDDVLRSDEPVVLRNLVGDWPLVRAGRESSASAMAYLRRYMRDAEVVAMVGPPEIAGRLFYNDDLSGFNFHAERPRLGAVLNALDANRALADPPSVYLGSTMKSSLTRGMARASRHALAADRAR